MSLVTEKSQEITRISFIIIEVHLISYFLLIFSSFLSNQTDHFFSFFYDSIKYPFFLFLLFLLLFSILCCITKEETEVCFFFFFFFFFVLFDGRENMWKRRKTRFWKLMYGFGLDFKCWKYTLSCLVVLGWLGWRVLFYLTQMMKNLRFRFLIHLFIFHFPFPYFLGSQRDLLDIYHVTSFKISKSPSYIFRNWSETWKAFYTFIWWPAWEASHFPGNASLTNLQFLSATTYTLIGCWASVGKGYKLTIQLLVL